ncbi:hypothetical protein MGA3_17607 (plasmid) [Bacillus methanolicus MGA3]|uniref:Uncharacterized protein n=1 Tax=Bacillus methanolicus (strain MGA3 / ATCC 53907) TaxID=796606 RepID=I3DTG6_BACMM|nr:hypothetical protein BMMGA3_16930 [Bacillus methanolicus MGA3]EIJ77537.1 hypothetical protein MGA3_17607 [Bacillus methanolicus MGA3]
MGLCFILSYYSFFNPELSHCQKNLLPKGEDFLLQDKGVYTLTQSLLYTDFSLLYIKGHKLKKKIIVL